MTKYYNHAQPKGTFKDRNSYIIERTQDNGFTTGLLQDLQIKNFVALTQPSQGSTFMLKVFL